jgi:hypothetical protein
MMHPAEEYLIQHELDLQDSNDLKVPGIMEREISPEFVKEIRHSLKLSLEMFALLLGINFMTMLRYESISVPPYPQGNISRKLCLLSGWLADPKSHSDIKTLLEKENGMATLSGLLQSESVSCFIQLTNALEDSLNTQFATGAMFQAKPGQA